MSEADSKLISVLEAALRDEYADEDTGELSLEESLKLYEEGIRLSRLCHGKLEEAEGKIEMLMKDARGEPLLDKDGRPKTKPLPRSEDDDGR